MYYKNSSILPFSKFKPENSVRVESMQFRIRNKIQVKTESGSNCLDKNYVRPRKNWIQIHHQYSDPAGSGSAALLDIQVHYKKESLTGITVL